MSIKEQHERAERLIAFCEDVGWDADETRSAMGQALVTLLNRQTDSEFPPDRYYHVLNTVDGHDLWLHDKEPLIRFDMSQPSMMRRGVPLGWVERLIFVAEKAREILTADRRTLGLEGQVAQKR